MVNRTWLLARCIPIVALIAAGCSDQPTPSSPDAKANQPQVAGPAPVKGKAASKVKRPKVLSELTGPSQLVD